MSSIFSTQKRHTFLRRKYCFFWVATALSPPVGLCEALPGLPLLSAILFSFRHRLAEHLLRYGWLRRWWRGRRLAAGPDLSLFLAFVQTLQGLVNAHGHELHHHVRHAQPPLKFLHRFRSGVELHQHISALAILTD